MKSLHSEEIKDMDRYGITIPFDDIDLASQREIISSLPDLGYTDVWSSEAMGADAFTPLVLASQWAPQLRLGTAIVPVYTRGPATLAQCVGSLAQVAPGRVVLGVGSSSNVIVERWNSIPFAKPYQRTRDTVRFLRSALAGQKVSEEYETFAVKGFRLGVVPPEPVPILVAALRKEMLSLAGREGDGAILNWLSAEDVRTVAPIVHAGGEGREIVARLFVAPSADREKVLAVGRFAVAMYLTVPVYRAFHEWLGRGELIAPMCDAWARGDRGEALAAIPESLVDELIISGEPEACREHVARYVDAGVTTPVLAVLPVGVGSADAVRALAPV